MKTIEVNEEEEKSPEFQTYKEKLEQQPTSLKHISGGSHESKPSGIVQSYTKDPAFVDLGRLAGKEGKNSPVKLVKRGRKREASFNIQRP